MRIISGTARGTKLYTLDSLETRPTLDRVKESIFNIINQDIQDTVFLDLFSGSGAIGLEAVSRGVKKAILCDNSKSAVDIINKNIEKTHLKDKITLYNLDFEKALHKIKQENEIIDYIYLDPPYKTDYVIKALNLINDLKLNTKDTQIIVETDDRERVIKYIEENFEIIKERKYGRAIILFLKYKK